MIQNGQPTWWAKWKRTIALPWSWNWNPPQKPENLSKSFEKTLIAKALAHTGGRRIEAAGLLGIGRNTITRKIGELGIADESPPESE